MKINRDLFIWILQFLYCQFGPAVDAEPQLEDSVKLIFQSGRGLRFAFIQRRLAVFIEARAKVEVQPNRDYFILSMADIQKIMGWYENSPLNELEVYTMAEELIIDNGPITTHYEEAQGKWIDDGYPLVEPFFDPRKAIQCQMFGSSPMPDGIIDLKIGIMK